jgi:hypothetical protein
MNLKFRQKQEEVAPGLRSVPVLDRPRNTNYPRIYREKKRDNGRGIGLPPIFAFVVTWISLPIATAYVTDGVLPADPFLAGTMLHHGMVGAVLLAVFFSGASAISSKVNITGVLLSQLVWTLSGAFWIHQREPRSGVLQPISGADLHFLSFVAWSWQLTCFLGIFIYARWMVSKFTPSSLDEL